MTATARRLYVNPSDPSQRHVLWTNGYVQPIGGTPPVPQEDRRTAAGQSKSPTFYDYGGPGPVAALAILDWATPAGYTIDHWGFVWPWGGAPLPPGGVIADSPLGGQLPYTGVPEFLFGSNGGFQSVTFGHVCDFAMDPSANGLGYYATYWGDLIGFGTGVPAVAHSAFLYSTAFTGWRLAMDWASKRYWIMDRTGRFFGLNGGNDVGVDGGPALRVLPGVDAAAVQLYDRSADPRGWLLNGYGDFRAVGAAEAVYGATITPGSDQWSDFQIIDDGTGANPLRLVAMTWQGTFHEWISSTPPTVNVVTPDDPTSNTTRPTVTWSYSDPQGDAQAAYLVHVFGSATYGAGGFAPDTSPATFTASGVDPSVRSVQLDHDIANDDYRAYVRAQDTSGLWSAWDYIAWTQDVTPPAVPTITATAGGGLDGITLAVHVDPSGLDPAARLAVQYSDDGASWTLVYDADQLTPDGSGDATASDLEAAFGVERTYRAICYLYDPDTDTWSASGWSTTDTATLGPRDVWALTGQGIAGLLTDQHFEVDATFATVATSGADTYWPDGRHDPIVVSDGGPKAPAINLQLWALTSETREAVQTLFDADVSLLLRDPFGEAWWVRLDGDLTRTLVVASPLAGEETSIRDSHSFQARVQVVRRPTVTPTAGPLAVT